MLLKDKELYEFGSFRLDVTEHILARLDGVKNGSLPEKAFQTLCVLVRNQGRLLTKQQLLDQIWPDSFVEENNLDKCIHAIRHALGEKPGEQRFIETVRKHGYRFVADVKTIEASQEASANLLDSKFLTERTALKAASQPIISTTTTESGSFLVSAKWSHEDDETDFSKSENNHQVSAIADLPPTLQSTPKSWTIRGTIVVAILLLAASAAAVYFLILRPTDSAAVAGTKSIAVFPLHPIDRANRNDLYEIGIADSLIHQLGAAKGIVVRPLSSTRKYTEIEQDPIAAGREQKVDYVVVSNYQIADGRIKVTSQLLNVGTGKVEDTFSVEKDAASMFSAQDAVAGDIGGRLIARFGVASAGLRSGRGTNSEEAYTHYLQAMNLSEERGVNNVLRALEHLDRAVALDPNYAVAWAGKAHIHRDIVGHTDSGQHEHYQKSMEAIMKALVIDPNLSDAYSALCHNKNRYEYDFKGAETACKRALELDPNSSLARKIHANFLYSRGRFDEAIVEIKTAMELQPVSYQNQQIYALTLYFARRYDEAEEQFKQLIELNPNHSFIHGRIVLVLQEHGKEAEAFEFLMKMLAIQKEDEQAERLRNAFQTGGWRGVLIERIEIAEAGDYPRYFQLACLYAKIGEKNKAFEYLEKAFQERRFEIAILQVEPQLDSLRDDPRFADLVRRVEGN